MRGDTSGLSHNRDLADKRVVITGGTSGVGRCAALMLAVRGAEVHVVGRSVEAGKTVESRLWELSEGRGSFHQADLSLVRDARRVVAHLSGQFDALDALIQSVGAIEFEPRRTVEGHNKMFVSNFLHKVTLADGLRPALSRAGGRMIVVAAAVPRVFDTIDWRNFEGDRVYAGMLDAWHLNAASLALVQAYAEAWRAANIEVTAIHPGQVDTGLFRSFRGLWQLGRRFMGLFHVPVEAPASLLAWLAFSRQARGLSGHFFPSVKDFGKRRVLRANGQTLSRVRKVADDVLMAT